MTGVHTLSFQKSFINNEAFKCLQETLMEQHEGVQGYFSKTDQLPHRSSQGGQHQKPRTLIWCFLTISGNKIDLCKTCSQCVKGGGHSPDQHQREKENHHQMIILGYFTLTVQCCGSSELIN